MWRLDAGWEARINPATGEEQEGDTYETGNLTGSAGVPKWNVTQWFQVPPRWEPGERNTRAASCCSTAGRASRALRSRMQIDFAYKATFHKIDR